MPSTTPYSFGDVVLVGFPFTSLAGNKKRPAVVISSRAYQESRPDIIVIAVTSRIRGDLSCGEHLIRDWEAAGLVKPSLIKPLIATLERAQVLRTIGTLTLTDQQALRRLLTEILS